MMVWIVYKIKKICMKMLLESLLLSSIFDRRSLPFLKAQTVV